MDRAAAFPPDSWERTPPEAQADIRILEARVETLTAMVHALQEQVGTLQERLHQTLQPSSPALSSDPSHTQPPRRPRRHRRRGGPPGHPGPTRPLVPVDAVDEVVISKPDQCMHCQAPFSGDDPTPWRHQVRELAAIEPRVTAYQGHQVRCAVGGEVTRAPWPAGGPRGT
jgi:transposase